MADFFKQLISQLAAIWNKLSTQQKIITASLVALTVVGLIALMAWTRATAIAPSSGYQVLYSDLDASDAATVTGQLHKENYKYKLENDGRTVLVEKKQLYEIRMSLARAGLPKSHGIGYEIFDKTNLGTTDFVQKLNAKRALEGELQRTIEGLEEVKSARVHIVIPEPTIFLENQKEAKASVVVRMAPNKQLDKSQIRGISYLISSSVEGLKPENISVVDYEGKLLTSPYNEDATAIASSRNVELQQNVEKYLEIKAEQILSGVLGDGKAKVKISVAMDFDQVDKTIEKYDPESRVVRSEERDDQNVKNAPDGDRNNEKSLTNYEIDKTVEHIVAEVGNIKRLTVSVAVDGKYEMPKDKKSKPLYSPRSPEELQSLEDMVKNSVGYDVARGDQISMTNVQFENDVFAQQRMDIRDQDQWERNLMIAKIVAVIIIALLLLGFLRGIVRNIATAMNPPVPQIEEFGKPEQKVSIEVPETIQRSSEVLDRVETMTHEEPVNISAIIRQWINEPVGSVSKKKR